MVQAAGQCAVIVEADFVPVSGFGELRCPIPGEALENSVAWLYFGGGRLRNVDEKGFAQGNAPTAVALLVGPGACAELLEFGRNIARDGGLKRYVPWDTQLAVFLRNKGVRVYLPFKSFGEHGGVGNREHEAHGVRTTHRADVLSGPLAFLPDYAQGRKSRYWQTRLFYRFRGTVKFFVLKYVPFEQMIGNEDYSLGQMCRLLAFSLRRFFT